MTLQGRGRICRVRVAYTRPSQGRPPLLQSDHCDHSDTSQGHWVTHLWVSSTGTQSLIRGHGGEMTARVRSCTPQPELSVGTHTPQSDHCEACLHSQGLQQRCVWMDSETWRMRSWVPHPSKPVMEHVLHAPHSPVSHPPVKPHTSTSMVGPQLALQPPLITLRVRTRMVTRGLLVGMQADQGHQGVITHWHSGWHHSVCVMGGHSQ